MRADTPAAPHWNGQVLTLPPQFGPRVALDVDGIWFNDVHADAHGRLEIAFPFAPVAGCALALTVRDERDGRILWPPAGTPDDAPAVLGFSADHDGAMLVDRGAQPMRAAVAIIVPVYNAAADVRRCLDSVLAHTTGDTRLIVIDDASPDADIAPLLACYAGLRGVEVHTNRVNLGFTSTVNRGIALAARADVVLLNADTEVGPNWLTGLRRAAHARADIATATAVSDNAGAFSVPELERENPPPAAWSVAQTARALWQHAGQAYPMLPTGNGFCMYVRRAVIDAIGTLDASAFPQGYGEENDFCQRASAIGLRHAIAGNVFVRHARSRSFGVERRLALGQAGMQVLRARWPNYEAEVGATLFSFERRVLDWRVRRVYAAAAAGTEPRMRVLRVQDRGAQPDHGMHEFWSCVRHGTRLELGSATDRREPHAGPVAPTADALAQFLERHAIDLVDLADAGSDALTAMLASAAHRLGIAVLDNLAIASSRESGYTVALQSLRSFPDAPA